MQESDPQETFGWAGKSDWWVQELDQNHLLKSHLQPKLEFLEMKEISQFNLIWKVIFVFKIVIRAGGLTSHFYYYYILSYSSGKLKGFASRDLAGSIGQDSVKLIDKS